MNWFECKVKYDKTFDNGLVGSVIEPYVVEAASCSDAETRVFEGFHFDCCPSIESVGKRRYSDIFFNDSYSADKWYKGKLSFITIDEKSGAEKKQSFVCLIQASDFKDAVKHLEEQMNGTFVDYEIVSIAETAIMDVIKL